MKKTEYKTILCHLLLATFVMTTQSSRADDFTTIVEDCDNTKDADCVSGRRMRVAERKVHANALIAPNGTGASAGLRLNTFVGNSGFSFGSVGDRLVGSLNLDMSMGSALDFKPNPDKKKNEDFIVPARTVGVVSLNVVNATPNVWSQDISVGVRQRDGKGNFIQLNATPFGTVMDRNEDRSGLRFMAGGGVLAEANLLDVLKMRAAAKLAFTYAGREDAKVHSVSTPGGPNTTIVTNTLEKAGKQYRGIGSYFSASLGGEFKLTPSLALGAEVVIEDIKSKYVDTDINNKAVGQEKTVHNVAGTTAATVTLTF